MNEGIDLDTLCGRTIISKMLGGISFHVYVEYNGLKEGGQTITRNTLILAATSL